MISRFFLFLVCALSFSSARSQTPSVSPQLLRSICLRVQLMGDNANLLSVADYLDQTLAPVGFKQVSCSETEWVYAKNVGLKEIPGGFVYDFQGPDAQVLQVSAYGRVTADLLLKNMAMIDYYRQTVPLAGFVCPDLEASPQVFVQVGGNDDFLITQDEESCMLTVSYHVAFPTVASDMLAPSDAIAMVGIPLDEARQKVLTIGYDDALTRGHTHYYLHGCQLDGETSPFKYKPSADNEGIPYSALILNSADSLVKNVRLNIYRCDRNVFLYDLSRAGFQLVAQKGKLMRFESVVQRKRATLERLVDTDSWSVFIEKM